MQVNAGEQDKDGIMDDFILGIRINKRIRCTIYY